jgi:two-component system chemotaxis response regulator CheB
MVDGFMDSFANRFKNIKHLSVSIVEDNQSFAKNNIYICEGETQLANDNFTKKVTSLNSYNPNINILFNSFTSLAQDKKILCVILIGIGDDGIEACKNLSLNGALCITESKESTIVDGMPSRARLLVPNIKVYNIDNVSLPKNSTT